MGSHFFLQTMSFINYWPDDGSLEPKHVANYVLMTMYVFCLAGPSGRAV